MHIICVADGEEVSSDSFNLQSITTNVSAAGTLAELVSGTAHDSCSLSGTFEEFEVLMHHLDGVVKAMMARRAEAALAADRKAYAALIEKYGNIEAVAEALK